MWTYAELLGPYHYQAFIWQLLGTYSAIIEQSLGKHHSDQNGLALSDWKSEESLRLELRARQCGRVGIMAVCPYLVDTQNLGQTYVRNEYGRYRSYR